MQEAQTKLFQNLAGESAQVLLHVDKLCKRYPKLNTSRKRWDALWAALRQQPYDEYYEVLHEVSFQVRRGESLGVIGENGAGKSTLLKLIAGVLTPSSGTLQKSGRVAAMLELGAGFHPDYSGLENLRISGALQGLSPHVLNDKLEQIIEFAGLGDYIHEPIKHYSSGMVVRLGFALMTASEPELLITDEVLAVGDESFQKRCIHWMEEYLKAGGTILFCSHGMYHIQKLCQRALWLERGRVRQLGDSLTVTRAYLDYHEVKAGKQHDTAVKLPQDAQAGAYRVQSVKIYDGAGVEREQFDFHQDIIVEAELYSPDGRMPTVGIGFERRGGLAVFGVTNEIDGVALEKKSCQIYSFRLRFPRCELMPGQYRVRISAMDPEAIRLFDNYELSVEVIGQQREFGCCYLDHVWEHRRELDT